MLGPIAATPVWRPIEPTEFARVTRVEPESDIEPTCHNGLESCWHFEGKLSYLEGELSHFEGELSHFEGELSHFEG